MMRGMFVTPDEFEHPLLGGLQGRYTNPFPGQKWIGVHLGGFEGEPFYLVTYADSTWDEQAYNRSTLLYSERDVAELLAVYQEQVISVHQVLSEGRGCSWRVVRVEPRWTPTVDFERSEIVHELELIPVLQASST
jgi:hypothetical protein